DYWIFQQDGASAHTALSIRDWFKEQNIEVLPWCPRSPDLSPIENLWPFMDAKLVNTRITSIDHLKQVLHKEWLSVSTEYALIRTHNTKLNNIKLLNLTLTELLFGIIMTLGVTKVTTSGTTSDLVISTFATALSISCVIVDE
ncbi:unnamed protein product, partial [Brachionus calyciflorus]